MAGAISRYIDFNLTGLGRIDVEIFDYEWRVWFIQYCSFHVRSLLLIRRDPGRAGRHRALLSLAKVLRPVGRPRLAGS